MKYMNRYREISDVFYSLYGSIGSLSSLETIDKTSIVNALNEAYPPKHLKLNSGTVTSDDYVRTLATGMYIVNSSTNGYIPFGYGTVYVIRAGESGYGYALGVGTNNGLYIRHFNGTEWHQPWTQLAPFETGAFALSLPRTTISGQSGTYVKVGNIVFARTYFKVESGTTQNDYATIQTGPAQGSNNRGIVAHWSSTNSKYGILCNAPNSASMWFVSKDGLEYDWSADVQGYYVEIAVTYMT